MKRQDVSPPAETEEAPAPREPEPKTTIMMGIARDVAEMVAAQRAQAMAGAVACSVFHDDEKIVAPSSG